jgi:type IV pilus assembly protein PilQ
MNALQITVKQAKLLAVLALLLTMLLVSGAAEQDQPKTEVLTSLEQRMQKKISVDFRDTPIDDVLRIMADQADVDIVKSPKVIGTVTTTLTDVPLEEALNNILAAHGFAYVAGENMIRVAPAAEIAEKNEMLVSRIYRITYASVQEVEKALQKFISNRGSLSSSPATSNIIVTDSESKIKAIDTFIAEIDRITPQILVEARIYDITSKERLDLGVEWEAGRNTSFSSVTGKADGGPRNPFFMSGFEGATTNTETAMGAIRFGFLNSSIDIDVMLTAQEEHIQAKLLANPRILVLDNERAVIKIISEIPYQEISESSGGGQVSSTEFREVGVELEVTPHLTRDDVIRLQLKPKFSVKAQDVTLGTTNNTFPVPVIDRREADTSLLVQDGQTIVLGGLRKKDISIQHNKVPLLGDIPILGALFKFEGEDAVNSELMVFVTPHIVRQPRLTEDERLKYEVTNFEGPQPKIGRFEKPAEQQD